jgi:methyl-accepting chemotaxis protein
MGTAFASIAALIVVAAGAGWWGLQETSDVQQRLGHLEEIRKDIDLAHYHAADISGWQALYVLDVSISGFAAATGPENVNRAGELKSKDAVYKLLAGAHTAYLSKSEQALWNQLKSTWDAFFADDDLFTRGMQTGGNAGIAAAMDTINKGPSYAAYEKTVELTEALEESLSSRTDATRAEAADVRRASVAVLLAALVTALLAAVLLSISTTRSVVRPLAVVVAALRGLAKGDLTVRADVRGRDELAELGAALNETTAALRGTVGSLSGHAEHMSEASTTLSSTAAQIATSAEHTSTQAKLVAHGADQVTGHVKTVSAGSEEMRAAIAEISHHAGDAAVVAAEAVSAAEATTAAVVQLGTSSQEIGNVVKVITSIAEQTNLLALNATIEAARAGEAGKGFAVVASEVKDLAQETARATDDIAARVQAIQNDTGHAVVAIEQIVAIIGRVSHFQNLIAAAVEEHTSTTDEMGRNVTNAADANGEIATNIASVARAAHTTADGANRSQGAADQLAGLAAELRGMVATFRL